MPRGGVACLLVAPALLCAAPALAQEPLAWGEDLVFNTFSIVGIDPATGESGVAVTTRVACVGNAVPWVRPGVGAVATQGPGRSPSRARTCSPAEQGVAREAYRAWSRRMRGNRSSRQAQAA